MLKFDQLSPIYLEPWMCFKFEWKQPHLEFTYA